MDIATHKLIKSVLNKKKINPAPAPTESDSPRTPMDDIIRDIFGL